MENEKKNFWADMTMFDRVDSFLAACDEAMETYGICLADGTVLCDESGIDTGARAHVNSESGFHDFMGPDGLPKDKLAEQLVV